MNRGPHDLCAALCYAVGAQSQAKGFRRSVVLITTQAQEDGTWIS
jgi:hypothetical protein